MTERPIGELADINPPLARLPRDSETVSFVSMADVSESGNLTAHLPQPFGRVKTGFTRFQDGDILFAKITPCMENGKGALVTGLEGGVGCGSTEFHVLRARSSNDPRYLYQWLQWSATRQKAQLFMSGSAGQQRVPAEFFRRFRIPTPELFIQRRIADVLSNLDDAINATEVLIEKHHQIKAGLMHDLFTRGVLASGELRPTRAAAPKAYREQSANWIPVGWQFERLDELALRGSGHTPNKEVAEYWNGGIKWVSLADSNRLDALYISDTELTISHRGIQNSSAVLHPAGMVVLSRDAGVGKSAITTEPMAVSQHFMCWKCDQRLDNHFLYYWLQFQKRTFENIAMGSTILTIGLPYFKKLRIACPVDLEEQSLIAARLKAADQHLFAQQRRLSKLRAQKLGLMQDLLTGRVSVSPAAAATELSHA